MTRRLTVSVPVEEPKLWTTLADQVSELAGFVSHDRWRFRFTRLKRRYPKNKGTGTPLRNHSINLFSGGLDSLCGAAAAIRRGETPIVVSHSPPGSQRVCSRIEALAHAFGKDVAKPNFFSFIFRVSERASDAGLFPERTRRTRPMLFLSMAGAAALELEVRRVFLNENGVLAVNLPFQPNLSGPQISRHAHPETLRRFESLLRGLWPFDSTPIVQNPLFNHTKAEELRLLGDGLQLASETISCEYAAQQVASLIGWLKRNKKPFEDARECGLCIPCLVRRSAMHSIGVRERKHHYVFDARRTLNDPAAYLGAPLFDHVAPQVRDLYDFCVRLSKMKHSEFVVSYLSELSLLPGENDEVGQLIRSVYNMYARFAKQFVNYFKW
jgi:7-cyano-7-deazaguanine synthase in queuosine biosynthesis